MNILYSGDGNTLDGIIISVLSLCKAVDEPINVYILTSSVETEERQHKPLPPDFAAFLEETVRKYSPEHSVKLYDISDMFREELPTANMGTRFTPCCMLRLFADEVEDIPDRILYLDNDVICRLSPLDFYYQNLDNSSLAGVLDYYGSWFFRKNIFRRDYLNSGVLLLNMKRIRENGLFRKCREKCRDDEMFMPDQSALNKLCEDKKICKGKYNDQRRGHKNTVFRHYTTSFRLFPWFHSVSVKPWNIEGMHKTLGEYEYDALLSDYLTTKEKYKNVYAK